MKITEKQIGEMESKYKDDPNIPKTRDGKIGRRDLKWLFVFEQWKEHKTKGCK
jgi:hypothetical protein